MSAYPSRTFLGFAAVLEWTCTIILSLMLIVWFRNIYLFCATRSISISRINSINSTSKTPDDSEMHSPDLNIAATTPTHVQSLNVADSKENADDVDTIVKHISTVAMAASSLYVFSSAIWLTWQYIDWYHEGYLRYACIDITFRSSIYLIGKAALFQYYVSRLNAFNDSLFEYNSKTIKTLKYMNVISCLVALFLYLFIIIGSKCNFEKYGAIALTPGILMDFFWSWLLCGLFVYKVRRIIKTFGSVFDNNNNHNPTVQLGFISSKLSILITVTSSSGLLCYGLYYFINTPALAIDICINLTCLLLSFKVFEKSFKKYCKLCRQCCERGYK